MPKRVDQYRLHAIKCFELAQISKDPDARRSLFAMADAWVMLAAQRAKNIEKRRAYAVPPDAPFDRDLELAVIDYSGTHALAFPCHRVLDGWLNAKNKKPVTLYPTHWREWRQLR